MMRRDLRAIFCPLWPTCAWAVYSRGTGAADMGLAYRDIGLDTMRHIGATHPEIVAGMTPAASWRARYRQLLAATVGMRRN